MEFNYYITRVNGVGSCEFADLFITPLRWLLNGKEYTVIRKVSDDSLDYSHTLRDASLSKCERVVKRILGFLGTVFLFPLVLIGFIAKRITENEYSKEDYAMTESIRDFTGPSLLRDKISKSPLPIASPTLVVSNTHNIDSIVTIWEKVGKTHVDYDKIRNHLDDWLKNTVPVPDKYTFISQKRAPQAAADLQNYLGHIIQIIEDGKISDDRAEQVILALYDASIVCPPTWLEVALKQYEILKGGDGAEQRVLNYVQQIKEDLIIDFTSTLEDVEWHALNYMRWLVGKELGLDVSHLKYDSAVINKIIPQYSKSVCLKIFHEHYTPDALINGMITKINLDKLGNFDPELALYLENAGVKKAKEEGIDVDSDEFDSAMYVLESYYVEKDGGYMINELGATQLLIETGLMDG